jgi:hypothetical protein
VRERRGVGLHSSDVAVRDVVLGVDCHGQRLDRRVVQAIDLRDVPASVFQPSERRPQSVVEDGDDRQHHRDRCQPDLAQDDDQTQPDRGCGEVADGEPQEMVAPDLERRTP